MSTAVTITRINRARFEPGVDYFPDDRCGCGRQLSERAGALDVLDEDDNWVDGEFICARCAKRADGEPPQQLITKADIDWAAEAAEADEVAQAQREADWEVASCCGGRDWFCGHYGCGVMTTRDYRDKYDCWDE